MTAGSNRKVRMRAAFALVGVGMLVGVGPAMAGIGGGPGGSARGTPGPPTIPASLPEPVTPSIWTVPPWTTLPGETTTTEPPGGTTTTETPTETTTPPPQSPSLPLDAIAIGDSNFPDGLTHLPPSHLLWRVRMFDGQGLSTRCGDRSCIAEQLGRDVAEDAPSLVVVTVGGVDALRRMSPVDFGAAIDELVATAGPGALVVGIGSMPLRGVEDAVQALNAAWTEAAARHANLWVIDPLADIVHGALDGSCLTRNALGAFGLAALEACYLDWAVEGIHLSGHGKGMITLFTTLVLQHWMQGASQEVAMAAAQRALRCQTGLPGCV